MTDYPDWQTSSNAIASNLYPDPFLDLPAGSYPSAVFPVTSFSSLSAVIVPFQGAGQLQVVHWADASGTVFMEGDTFRFREAASLVVRTPLRAAYVQLNLIVTSPVDLQASIWVSLLSASAERITYPVTGQQAGIDSQSLGPGAADEWRMPAINSGNAMLSFAPGDATGKLQLEVTATDELDSVLYHVMFPVKPTTVFNQPLQLPGEIIVVTVTNTDVGASHSYGVSLICPP